MRFNGKVPGTSLAVRPVRMSFSYDAEFGAYTPEAYERLLLDVKTHVPVALVRTEPHPLWGQVEVEYVWSNWNRVDAGVLFPLVLGLVLDV